MKNKVKRKRKDCISKRFKPLIKEELSQEMIYIGKLLKEGRTKEAVELICSAPDDVVKI